MSIDIMSDVWEGAPHSGGVFSVFLALADNADKNTGYCFPGLEYLAWKTRQSTRNVQHNLRQLADEDWITIVAGMGKNGTNGFYINKKKIADAAKKRKDEYEEMARKRQDEKISSLNPYREKVNVENSQVNKHIVSLEEPDETLESDDLEFPYFHLTIKNHQEPSDLKPSQLAVAGDTEKAKEVDIVERAFVYYCKKLKRDTKRYSLTPKRRERALSRLRERTKKVGREEACREIAHAIENLANSSYHRENNYIDWNDHIFGSAETFEKRLNWKTPQNQGGTKSEQQSKLYKSNENVIDNWIQNTIGERNQEENVGCEFPSQGRVILGETGRQPGIIGSLVRADDPLSS